LRCRIKAERILLLLVVLALAAPASAAKKAGTGTPAPPPAAASAQAESPGPASLSAADQEKMLSVRAALVDGCGRLADMVLASRLPDKRTIGAAIGAVGDGETSLRLMLRTARIVGDPRVYSDGVAEVDVEMSFDALARKVAQLCGLKAGDVQILADLRPQVIDGYLRAEGRGRAPPDLAPEVMRKAEAARLEELVEMFPADRIDAYAAMERMVRAIRLGPTGTIGDMASALPAAETLLDTYLRALPVAAEPRMMPDRIAEVDVVAQVRDLIKVLKDIRALEPADQRMPEDRIDQLSINLKSERLSVTGYGMPSPDQIKPDESLPTAPGPTMPDWAAWALEARGTAKRSDDIEDVAEANILAARSAKARAMSAMERQLDAVRLEDGRTVRDRAAKDEVFRRDVVAMLAGAKTVKHEEQAGGKQWEVVVRLPLLRLWEFSRSRE
jgi:hypothetical protein